ncbi:uncharacterized ABC transporter ATP-binding protein Mb1304c-like [Periplaneta americana]|uniref:uncharacterized ABC transporter ATP-binding protein Mb1304c-like n=1 Tax=Periplaneta americana TaxID=6978 RepID=UPI0037E99A9E
MQDSNQPLLDFQSVSFSHLGAQNDTLSDLNFTLYAGKTLAIIGGTGSGKSTIAQLVPRLYDVASGHIFVEGQDVKEWKQSQLHDRISIVPQKSVLFSGSIKDNLTLGNPSATEEDIWGVLSIAQADFVKELPEGLDSLVEQGGKNFSGGQKQRLSIARALLKPSCIYIFDDSFSALDYKTDAQLRKSMKGFLKDVGVLLIAQRVSSIVDADEIIVLDNGKIVGKGTHEELKNNNHVYQEIMESQMGKEEL